jgi:hypothetical protein
LIVLAAGVTAACGTGSGGVGGVVGGGTNSSTPAATTATPSRSSADRKYLL